MDDEIRIALNALGMLLLLRGAFFVVVRYSFGLYKVKCPACGTRQTNFADLTAKYFDEPWATYRCLCSQDLTALVRSHGLVKRFVRKQRALEQRAARYRGGA